MDANWKHLGRQPTRSPVPLTQGDVLSTFRIDLRRLGNTRSYFSSLTPMGFPEKQNEFVNATTVPRIPLVAKGVACVTSKLHKYSLHNVVGVAKKTGLQSLAYSYSEGEDRMPKLAETTRAGLIDEYGDDISFLEEKTGRNLLDWRVP